MTKAVVTAGAGFIGSHITGELAHRGIEDILLLMNEWSFHKRTKFGPRST